MKGGRSRARASHWRARSPVLACKALGGRSKLRPYVRRAWRVAPGPALWKLFRRNRRGNPETKPRPRVGGAATLWERNKRHRSSGSGVGDQRYQPGSESEPGSDLEVKVLWRPW